MWSQYINIEISSLLLWPIDLLLSDALLYFYDNKRILILILILSGYWFDYQSDVPQGDISCWMSTFTVLFW